MPDAWRDRIPDSSADPSAWMVDDPCEVRSGGEVVRYRRAGAGSPVLLLCDGTPGGTWVGLAAALSGTYRLIVPDLAPADGIGVRLSGFLEGLGAAPVCIVVGPVFWAHVPELLALAEEQMARAVVVAADDPMARDLDDALALDRPRPPVLLLHRRIPAESVFPAILRFIADAEALPAG